MQLQPDGAAWSIRDKKEGLLTSYVITSVLGCQTASAASFFISSPFRLHSK